MALEEADGSKVVFEVGEFDRLIEDITRISEVCAEDPKVTKMDLELLRKRLLEKEIFEKTYHSLQAA